MPRPSLAFVFAVTMAAAVAHAQVAAELQGRVLDPSQAPLPYATVRLTNAASNIAETTTTSGTGDYRFSQVNPGTYRLDVDAQGFEHLRRTGVNAVVGQTVTVDLMLALGSANQTVTVDGDAPLLQAATSNIETNIPGTTVLAIALNARNFIQLSTLAPGVSLPPGTLLPRINGGRPRTNEYLYDGISALQPEPGQVAFFPILDDIHEFTVEANNVPAEFGRFNGGVVNVATRSGSNTVHGSLFEFFRNEALNARNYFTPAGNRKPEYRRNVYGGTLSGSLLRDKVFAFGDYQGIKQLIGVTRFSTVPTVAERQGNFSGVAHIFDPGSTLFTGGKYVRREFAGDVITRPLDPVAQALLARIPLPTTTGTANNYSRTANDADHQNQFDLRVDATLGRHDQGFARYSYFSDVEQPVTPFPDGSGVITGATLGTGGVVGLSHVLGQQAVLNETHLFTDHLLNDLRLGYTRRGNTIAGTTLGSSASSALGIPGIPTNAAFNNALPLFTFTGFQQLGPSPSTFAQYQTAVWQGVDSISYSHGKHAFKVGADVRFYQLNAVSPPNPTGSFAFTTTGTNQQGLTISASDKLTNGNGLASFLLGQVDTFSIDLQQSTIRPRAHIQEYFAQDDWKVSERLTLNLGARWTFHSPSTEKNNQGAVFNLQTQQLDYLGQNGNSRSARQLHYTDIGPRVGFAYRLTPETVVRAGFGIVFIDQSGITTPFTTPQFPFIQNVQQRTQDSVNAAFGLANGPTVAPIALTANAGLGQSVYTSNRTAGSGYVQQWNLAVQRTITKNLSVDVAYVGSHIVHVGVPDANLNQLTAAQLAQGSSLLTPTINPYFGQLPSSSSIGGKMVSQAQLLKPYPRFLNVATYRNNSGTTNYNAIEAKVEQRLSHGLYFLFAYTHSKLIDDASSVFSSTVLSAPNSNSLVAADTFRPYLERDSSNGDVPNLTSFAATYDLPVGSRHRFASSGITRAALGGWSVSVIVSLQSGMPVTITQATNTNAFAGFALQRPRILRSPALQGNQCNTARFFDTTAFATTPQFALGNASRNPVRGPAYRDLDLALMKHTRLVEGTDLELRVELFDVTNTPGFAQPNGSFGSPAFGSIVSTTTDPRVAQLALRFSR